MPLVHDLPTYVAAVAAPGQVIFTFPFKIYDLADIAVTVNGVAATYTALPTTGLQFLVTPGADEGGTIAFGAALSGGQTVTIQSQVPFERVTQFPSSGPVSMVDINTEFNRHISLMQRLRDQQNGAVQIPPGIGTIDAVTLLASEPLLAGAFINLAAGKVRNALASDPTRFACGFVLTSAATNAPVAVRSIGVNSAAAVVATAGETFLSDSVPGGFQLTEPSATGSIIQSLGPAYLGTGLLYLPQPRIQL